MEDGGIIRREADRESDERDRFETGIDRTRIRIDVCAIARGREYGAVHVQIGCIRYLLLECLLEPISEQEE